MTPDSQPSLSQLIEGDLLARLGSPLIGGERLRAALGYPTQEAMRQALARGTVPVPIFAVPHRRGKFALVKDVAIWLASLREGSKDR